MRCVNCEKLSFGYFCKDCERILRECKPLCRKIDSNFDVYFFYYFSEIKKLIHSKHHFYGSFVYKRLAKFSFAKFGANFAYPQKILAIGLENADFEGYSHTAILVNSLKSDFIKPKFGALKATSDVKYSAQSLAFRQKHKRKYRLFAPISSPVILVDDIITTGESMRQAKEILDENGAQVLFGLVLADARF